MKMRIKSKRSMYLVGAWESIFKHRYIVMFNMGYVYYLAFNLKPKNRACLCRWLTARKNRPSNSKHLVLVDINRSTLSKTILLLLLLECPFPSDLIHLTLTRSTSRSLAFVRRTRAG